jgi:glycosyltransferase involved in cell wall biosynthesis
MTESAAPGPWLSVIVPTYNGGRYLARAFAGIELQGRECGDLEILVVDDGSTDSTLEVVRRFQERLPIRLIASERTGNWAANTNRALADASGRYVSFLHQDDAWLPGRVTALKSLFARHPDAAMALHPVWFIDASGWRLGAWRCPLPEDEKPLLPAAMLERLVVQNFIALPAPVVDRRVALEAGGLDERLWYTADWDFWLKIVARGNTLYTPRALACFRIHGRSQTVAAATRPAEMRRQLEEVLRRHFPVAKAAGVDASALRVAGLSVDLNCLLAGRGRGWAAVLRRAWGLSAEERRRFLRDSRLGERLGARVVGLLGTSRGPVLDDVENEGVGASAGPESHAGSRGRPDPERLDVTVLIPCRNEVRTIGACVLAAREGLSREGLEGEVLVADDGSEDGSPEEARRHGARVVTASEPGYGGAMRAGVEAARGDRIVAGGGDGGDDLTAIGSFRRALDAGADLVVGCRLESGGGQPLPGAMSWQERRVWLPLLAWLSRLLFGTRLRDVVCGFRAFRRDAILALDLRTTGLEYASEMTLKAARSGLKIAEVPVTRIPSEPSGWSANGARRGWRHLRFMLLFSPRWLFFAPGLSAALFGILLGVRLLLGPFSVFGFTLDTNSLLVCSMAIVVGLQLCLFAVFAEIFSVTEGLTTPSPSYPVLFRIFTLERGLVAGAATLTAGVILIGRAILLWSAANFGGIPYAESLRIVIPGVTCVTVGTQIVFSSFFLSLLGLRRR